MNDNETLAIVDLIWDTISSVKNKDKSTKDKKDFIKSIIIQVSAEQRMVGREQSKNNIIHRSQAL